MQETWGRSLGQEDPLEKEMATHSRILACRIPWTEEPGGLQSMGLQRVRPEPLSTCGRAHTHTHTHVVKNKDINRCEMLSSVPSTETIAIVAHFIIRFYSLQPSL